jgi:hypothetical protein
VEVRTLSGFDRVKNLWTDYLGDPIRFEFPNRRGERALRDWIAEEAVRITGYPNPPCFSRYLAPEEKRNPATF